MTGWLDVTVRSSAVLLLALLAHRGLARSRASLRHAVLASALCAAAIVGPLGMVVPPWTIRLTLPHAEVQPPDGPSDAATVGDSIERDETVGSVTAAAGAHAAGSPASRAVAALWFAGAIVSLCRFLLSHRRLRRLARRARPLDDPTWAQAAHAAAAAVGIRRKVVLLETDAADVLATWGLARPRIAVPGHARGWPKDRVRAILSHELAHVARGDWLVQSLADLVLVAYWFNPFAWLVARLLRAESERACDDAVLRDGIPAHAYAAHLIEAARACRMSSRHPAVAATGDTNLHERVTAMLGSRSPVRALPRLIGMLVVLALASLVVPFAAVRVTADAPRSLSGVVYDPSGAVVPGAKLTLSREGQAGLEAVSDEAGRFEFPSIVAGDYVLEVGLPGFRVLKQSLALRDDRDWQRAIILQIGEVQETITIRSARLPAAPPAATPARVRVGGRIGPPKKLHDVRPEYPASMRAAGLEGRVALEAIIGRDGSVQSARVVSGLVHPDLAQAAIDAVRQWRFEPTTLNGTPVEVVMNVALTFELEK